MQNLELESQSNQLRLKGAITYLNLQTTLKQVKAEISTADRSQPMQILLSELEELNSLCLSFILSCLRYAATVNQPLSFPALPPALRSMLEVYNLSALVPATSAKVPG